MSVSMVILSRLLVLESKCISRISDLSSLKKKFWCGFYLFVNLLGYIYGNNLSSVIQNYPYTLHLKPKIRACPREPFASTTKRLIFFRNSPTFTKRPWLLINGAYLQNKDSLSTNGNGKMSAPLRWSQSC